MKKSKIILFVISFLTMGIMFTSCGNKSKAGHTHEMQGKEYTSTYVCPMHCEGSGSDAAGQCPVCGMDYVVIEEHKADGHKHEDHDAHSNSDEEHKGHDHDGEDHDDQDGHNH